MSIGKLIVLEGPDTSGKTTIIEKLKTVLPTLFENSKFIFTREPGNLIDEDRLNKAEMIRNLLLNNEFLTNENQTKLFASARAFHTFDIIEQLKKGNNVITDRYILSSIIYQGINSSYQDVIDANRETLDLLTKENIQINNIVLSLDKQTYNERMSKKTKDVLEAVDENIVDKRLNFYLNYKNLKKLNVGNIYHIDATKDIDYVVNEVLINIINILNK